MSTDKKPQCTVTNNTGKDLSQYESLDQPNTDEPYDEGPTLDEEGDSELEAELLALTGDPNNPDIPNELSEATGEESEVESPVGTTESSMTVFLRERLKMYKTAERNAKAAGESSRARRFTRGIHTLKDLIKQASTGQSVNDEDIPPEVSVHIPKEEPTGDVSAENVNTIQ